MKYYKEIKLKDGRTCVLRNGTEADGAVVGMAGIGRALTNACIECAGKTGYLQLELEA